MGKEEKTCSVCGTAYESATSVSSDDIESETLESSVMPSGEARDAAEQIAADVFVDVELEELVKLPGIGPLRAKILFDAGYTDLRKLKQASVVELMNIRGIGRKAAGEIKTALREQSLEVIRETPLTQETVGAEHQCPLCATIVSAYESSCYECGCNFKPQDMDSEDSDRLALSYYDSKLLRSPDSKDLWYARGATLMKMENYEQAQNSFNKALELDPSFQMAWMSKAEVYNKQGDSAKAAECYSHIITSASGGHMPGSEEATMPQEKEEDDLELEKPLMPVDAETSQAGEGVEVAEIDVTQPPVEYDTGPEIVKPSNLDLSDLQMDYNIAKQEKPDMDSMSTDELKKELASRASHVKPYLKLAKEVGVDINHAKRLVARAVTESKQNEFKVAIMLMDEGIEFAEGEFRRKILEDIENLAIVIRNLKTQGKDVSIPAAMVTETKDLLEAGMIAESTEKLKVCLEAVEKIAR
jgi:tetratricopeptide (TPR) repeat protein